VFAVVIVLTDSAGDVINIILDTWGAAVVVRVFPDIRNPGMIFMFTEKNISV
jgi:hypothetical protein